MLWQVTSLKLEFYCLEELEYLEILLCTLLWILYKERNKQTTKVKLVSNFSATVDANREGEM